MKNYLTILLFIVGGIFILWPLKVWAGEPELSQMQLIFRCWHLYIIGVAALLIGYQLYSSKD